MIQQNGVFSPNQLRFSPNQLRWVDELLIGRYCLRVDLLNELTVTLIRMTGAPKKPQHTAEWSMTIAVLTPAGTEMRTIALADYGIYLNDSSDDERWGYFQCLLPTKATTLPLSGDAAELLSPEEREQLQAKVTTVVEVYDKETCVDVEL